MKRIYRLSKEAKVVYNQVKVADRFWTRLTGLLGKSALETGEALLIQPCHQVHGFGMSFAIDTIFLDRELRVLAIQTLQPGTVGPAVRGAHAVLEARAGSAAELGISPGDLLHLDVVTA